MIRDVSGSYRRALQCTVQHYCGWQPSADAIDALKAEGAWNNDWDCSLELLRRHGAELPDRTALIDVFSGFYFGGDPEGDPSQWTGFIGDEPLLVNASLFTTLSQQKVRWGFVSGAEPASARFVLQQRLGLQDPPLIAMGDAPDKPDPTGLIHLAKALGADTEEAQVAYLGDTVADVHTVVQARKRWPEQQFVSLAVVPPHLQSEEQAPARTIYEQQLMEAGADLVLNSTAALLNWEGVTP
ncbi:TIGR01548 family HAD-type hydrolase [Synechococcus sp. PROS-U-1]|uniref:TIGR01548 family HAD-type hydrolase n=1 Tax=Synechococcus sp. PROS-U-1 TaxID=1400866 RepID=UPI001860F7E3|nr:TIGR01548 family HAD-type hydrolase [Synechococcus sp. PROS-U-1]QNJ04212.1 putative imidazoleglycerol-phosphate dehydratase [Synechococcus sp. PROS-U-1]